HPGGELPRSMARSGHAASPIYQLPNHGNLKLGSGPTDLLCQIPRQSGNKGFSMTPILFTKVENKRGALSKSLALKNGKLIKTAAADMVCGHATQVAVRDIFELADAIEGLRSNQAATWGVSRHLDVAICTDDAAKRGVKNAIARTKKNWFWHLGRTVFMLDIDAPKDGSKLFKHNEIDAILYAALPWWRGVARMYRPSASALIYD